MEFQQWAKDSTTQVPETPQVEEGKKVGVKVPSGALGHWRERWGEVRGKPWSWPCSRGALQTFEEAGVSCGHLVRGQMGTVMGWASEGRRKRR